MPRLFRKFFTTIWLILAATVAVIILLVSLFQTAPFVPELDRQKRGLALDLAARILSEDGEEAAGKFVRASEQIIPLGLAITRVAEPDTCLAENTSESRLVNRGGGCFRVSIPEETSFIRDRLAVVMPWLAIFVSSTISAAALARYLIRPVVHLRDGLSALAHGHFDVRIGDKMAGRRDEVTALAHDFDATAARLQEFQDAQQQLFHDVSHELRSPLSRLQAAVGILHQNPSKLEGMLERMDREVERLDTLVGEVLTLARLTVRSNLPLRTQNVDVIELLNEILNDAAFEALSREITITTNINGSFLTEIEGELIYRAFENVVRNAIKYTVGQSLVTVFCETKPDLLIVRISDEGPGVRADELERIFQPFSRGTNGMQGVGYGLGLAITRQAIERHGGRVWASLPENGGLAITLELPRVGMGRPSSSLPNRA